MSQLENQQNTLARRPTWAEIDLSALRWNLDQLVVTAQGASILAVIKANAYGHGAVEVARALLTRSDSGSVPRMLGVASVDEGRQLRRGLPQGLCGSTGALAETP